MKKSVELIMGTNDYINYNYHPRTYFFKIPTIKLKNQMVLI
jgi:hypothetical protein